MDDASDFDGVLHVDPPLTDDEMDLLDSIGDARRRRPPWRAPGEPPRLPSLVGSPPKGVCGWAACEQGCCLWIDDDGPSSVTSVVAWLRYLLRQDLGRVHTIGGVVVARNRLSGETIAIRVRANVVNRIRLWMPDGPVPVHGDEWTTPTPAPHQTDPWETVRPDAERGRVTGGVASVIDLASRRCR